MRTNSLPPEQVWDAILSGWAPINLQHCVDSFYKWLIFSLDPIPTMRFKDLSWPIFKYRDTFIRQTLLNVVCGMDLWHAEKPRLDPSLVFQ